MNVLLIGGDNTLLMENEDAPSNTKDRMKLMSKDISNIYIAILARNLADKTVNVSNKITVFVIPFRNVLTIIKAYWACSDICKKNKISVISCQDPFIAGIIGYLLKLKYGIPLNIQLHGDIINNEWWLKQKKINFLWNNLAKWLLRRVDTVRTVNEDIKENIVDMGVLENKIMNFPIFIDIDKFKSVDQNISRSNFGDFENLILFVGFLKPTKGIDTLLKSVPYVLEKYPKSLFLIVGKGSEKRNLEKLTQKLDITKNIIFTGEIPHGKLPDYYKMSNILVLPSRSEAWGRVVIEALIFKKPVIVSDACKISNYVINEEFGLTFHVNDHLSLANKIIFLLGNPKIADRMGEKGEKIVIKNYSFDVIGPKYLELWNRTIKEAEK